MERTEHITIYNTILKMMIILVDKAASQTTGYYVAAILLVNPLPSSHTKTNLENLLLDTLARFKLIFLFNSLYFLQPIVY